MRYFPYSVIFVISVVARNIDDYSIQRKKLIDEELDAQVGGKILLNEEESIANRILMRWKQQEIRDSFNSPGRFNLSNHYFKYKNQIPESKVYQIIKKMPKGAALHVHSSLMLSVDRLMELTYEDHLYACLEHDLKLHFSDTTPDLPCPVKWTLLSELRNAADNITVFDTKLKKHFTMYTEDENDMNADINTIWIRFNKVCDTIKSLISYRPVREKFFYAALKEFYNDNIMYIEIRSGLNRLYELDGRVHDITYLPRLYQQVAKRFMKEYPDFIGIKFIVTRARKRTYYELQEDLAIALRLKNDMPDLIAGFDLVGQEDLGKPLQDFLPALEEAKNEISFYFHGGETNWYGLPPDENLVDAVLLGSKRIGHGYALLKHPYLLQAVKKRDIAIEVNVISNVVLSLVRDVRNHPLAVYLALGLPVVLSSDDPGAWGADPLSHDFYVAFVGVASSHADIRLLKQLALNSIRYSALNDWDKTKMSSQFNLKWNEFIKDVISGNF
ncbi:adenosine deaminase 2-like [Epargyreus clarus]|uniref:adenosine deaminase 2-like n=1 Tax=Epargyreus clarus TaxID=520877 RepID=UPI003C2E1DA1